MTIRFYESQTLKSKVERYKDKNWCVSTWNKASKQIHHTFIENLYNEDFKTWNDIDVFIKDFFSANGSVLPIFRTNKSGENPVLI